MLCRKLFICLSSRTHNVIINPIKKLSNVNMYYENAMAFTVCIKRLSTQTTNSQVLEENANKKIKAATAAATNNEELVAKKTNENATTTTTTTKSSTQQTTVMPTMGTTTTSSVVAKNRFKKKKHKKSSLIASSMPAFKVKACATAGYYNLDTLKAALIKSGAYDMHEIDMPEHCICAKAKYIGVNEIEPRHIFFFDNGAVVFWNVSVEEQNSILTLLEKHSQKPYPKEIVKEESEIMSFSRIVLNNKEMLNITHHSNANGATVAAAGTMNGPNAVGSHKIESKPFIDDQISLSKTRLANNHIYFSNFDPSNKDNTISDELYVLEKYSFSDAIALSVKLGIWEKDLEKFSENIEYISEDLKRGRQLALDVEKVLQMLGELFAMKHNVNLHYSLLDTPDFYWYALLCYAILANT
jgi:uncharacterized Rmd1/YagE family protein